MSRCSNSLLSIFPPVASAFGVDGFRTWLRSWNVGLVVLLPIKNMFELMLNSVLK